MCNSITGGKYWLFLSILFILLIVSACGKNSATVSSSPFSNIPQGKGTAPEPGTDGKPIPYPYGHSESMIVSNGVDFVGSDNGKVYAFNGANGHILWQNNAGNPVDVFAVTNDTVYAYANSVSSGVVYALASGNGNIIWRYRVNDYISGALSGNIVYVTTAATGNKPVLYALRASDGALLWRYNAHSATPGLLAASDGVVYYAEISGLDSNFSEYISALQASDGHVLWRLHTATSDGYAYGISAPVDGVVYISTDPGAAYAVRASDGKVLWHIARSPAFGSDPVPAPVSPLVEHGVVYVSGTQGAGGEMQMLYALRVSDGQQLWSKAIGSNPGPIADQPVLANDVLYMNNAGKVSALRATDGSTLWQSPGTSAFGPLIALNGQLYVNSSDGVFVLRASDGAQLWKQSIPNHGVDMTGLTPEAASSDIVYAASEDGVVQAFNASDGHPLWRYAIQEKGQLTGVVTAAFITFTNATSYQQALRMITDLGLQTSNTCAFAWKPQTSGDYFSTSHSLFVVSSVGAAPLWLYRLKASSNVASVNVNTTMSCPAYQVGQKFNPPHISPGQVGTYLRVIFSSGNYDAVLNAINNLGFRVANPCYEQARARGSKPAWSLMGQEDSFAQAYTLVLATTNNNAATWQSQLRSLHGVTKVEAPFKASC